MTFIEAHCPSCGRSFRQSANRLCEGQVLSCPHCEQSWSLSRNSPFDEVVRLLRQGQDARQAAVPPQLGTGNRWYA